MEKEDDDGVSGKGEEGGVTEGDVAGKDGVDMSTSSVGVHAGERSSTDALLLGIGDSQGL